MTALEREMAADAVALSKEHADRADAAEARWAALRKEIESYRDTHRRRAGDLTDEGKDPAMATALARELDWVLAAMDRMEAGQ